jgi:glyoxylase-like metal-dependent hydrolase (beta-lactamase superfamily II)/ferredoxin
MADQRKRLDTNVAGNFYVDATCINCDTCRQLAPDSFEEIGEYSAVTTQPQHHRQIHQAYQALLACPVGSIGTEQGDSSRLQSAMARFPLHLDDDVHYCGFNSPKSFGANSFFVRHPDGNWLIDSPRYVKHLVEAFERMGGVAYIFLTHEDDVADADKYAGRFGAKRIIHLADSGAVPDAEWIIEGIEAKPLTAQFRAIPVPGHTPGSCALLYNDKFLFTGDHLWWEPSTRSLEAPRRLVWRARVLADSIEKLLNHRFEWVLGGHGDRVHLPAEELRTKTVELLGRRKSPAHS